MTKDEALRLALEALELMYACYAHPDWVSHKQQEEKILAQCVATTMTLRQAIKAALEAKDEPVGQLQKPTGERAWFTITELNAWADKKLSENPHWVMPKDEPERDDPPPQRTWVGLTAEEREQVQAESYGKVPHHVALIAAVEAKLREKNHASP